MSSHPSFLTLEKALTAYKNGQPREALAFCEAAWRMVQEIPGAPPQAALVGSWYGLLVGIVGGRLGEGMTLCRDAAKAAFWEPRVHENLARLELMAGHRREALATLERGLQLAPDDRELKQLRQSLGVRRQPPIGFLDRNHLLNRWVGLLTSRPS